MDTYGPEAGELMRLAGKPLDDWQQEGVTAILTIGGDRLWSCFEYCEICSRQNGKGAILEARVLAGFLLLKEKVIAWSAHEYRTSMEAFRRVKALLLALGTQINDTLFEINHPGVIGSGKPVPVKIVNTNGEEGFERLDDPDGDGEPPRIKFIARSKRAGRGFSGDLIIIDEAFAYTAEQQEAQMPITLARPNPQVIYASSPPLSGESGEVLFDVRLRAEEEIARRRAPDQDGQDEDEHESLGFRDWGLPGVLEDVLEVDKTTGRPKIDIHDVALWYQANPALGSARFTLANIRKLKRAMRVSKGVGFARECLGIWPRRTVAGGVQINPEKWLAMRDRESRRHGDVALAYDIAPDRSWAAIGLYALRVDGKGHMQLLDYRMGTEWLAARLAELRVVLDPLAIACGKGSFESMRTELEAAKLTVPEDQDKPHRGHIAVATVTNMSAATGRLLDTVNRCSAFHIGQDELDDASEVAQTRRAGDSIVWARKGDNGDICPLVAVTLAQWSFEIRGPMVQESKYDVLDSIG